MTPVSLLFTVSMAFSLEPQPMHHQEANPGMLTARPVVNLRHLQSRRPCVCPMSDALPHKAHQPKAHYLVAPCMTLVR
jgi:hypothetical protein